VTTQLQYVSDEEEEEDDDDNDNDNDNDDTDNNNRQISDLNYLANSFLAPWPTSVSAHCEGRSCNTEPHVQGPVI
jgi:TATA-binding protein-associated factor Taf7